MSVKDPAESAKAILSERRQKALMQAEQRRRQVYAAVPELAESEQEMARLMMETAAAASGENAAQELERLRGKMEEIRQKKKFYLVHGGFTEEDLKPHFTCPFCEDTGFVHGKRCSCYYQLYNREAGSLLPPAVGEGKYSFDRFDLHYYPDIDGKGGNPRAVMTKILERCKNYAEQFEIGSESLLFLGGTGLGKTHLSLAIADTAVKRGKLVLYTSAQGLIDRFERIRFNRNPTQEDFDWTKNLQSADLLILDDLGSEFVTQFSQSVLYTVLNERMMAERPTIISSNLEVAKLNATYDQRIASRVLCGFTALSFSGKDIRLLQKAERLHA